MKKRIISLLLTLMMLFSLPVLAEDDVEEIISNAAYRIVLRTEEGDRLLGSAVLFIENNVLLTAESCCVDGDLYAIGADGEHPIVAWEVAQGTSIALMEMGTPSTAKPLVFARESSRTLPYVFGFNPEGKFTAVPLHQALRTVYQGKDLVVFAAEEGMMPGAFAADTDGNITGLVVAQQTDGKGMYIAYDPQDIYNAMMNANSVDRFCDIMLSWENGVLLVTWEDEERTGGSYAVTVTADDNHYYTVYGKNAADRSCEFLLPPGHTYYVQVQWVEEGEKAVEPVWNAMTTINVREDLFSEYGFVQSCWVTQLPSGQVVPHEAPAMEVLTTGMLQDASVETFLQINCQYRVIEQKELPMVVELFAPDGQFFFTGMSFVFDPELQEMDLAAVSVQDLLAECASFSNGSLQPGRYTLSYYIGGMFAGECSFVVEEGAAPARAPETSGFITDLTLTEKPGEVTVSWDNASLPEGAAVMVFGLCSGNTYYNYREMAPGETETVFFTVPGRRLSIWAVWYTDDVKQHRVPERTGDAYFIVEAEPEAAYTLNGFTNHHVSVVPSKDAAAAMRNELLPVEPITREAILDPDTYIFFQTRDTYQVSETSSNHPLAIVLITPDGLCFVEYGYYIFDTSLQQGDQWLQDMSGLFNSYTSLSGDKAWIPGEYRILYCIDGQIAGQYTFVLE